jgi:hypothetical protein
VCNVPSCGILLFILCISVLLERAFLPDFLFLGSMICHGVVMIINSDGDHSRGSQPYQGHDSANRQLCKYVSKFTH